MLNTVGTLAHVEKGLLGLTILAWGNSIGDVQTNMAMAKRGLGNMAMTACIAGPIFNLLVGLGGGLLFYFSEHGTSSISVQLQTMAIIAGFDDGSVVSFIAPSIDLTSTE